MLKFIFVIIYASELTRQVSSLIIYDILIKVPPTEYGNAIITNYLKTVDVFYNIYGNITYCDFLYPAVSEFRWCDLMAYSQICILKQELMGHRNAKQYEGVDKRTFTVDTNKIVKDENQNKVDLICSNITRYEFEQSNSMYFPNDKLYFMSLINAPYSNIFTFTNYMGDEYFTGRGYYEDFGIYSVYVKAGYTQLQYSITFQVFTYIQIFNSRMLEEYVVKAKCSLGYYGKTCWYTCDDTHRLTCNCVYQDVYVNVPCQSVCKYGWLKKYIYFMIKTFYEVVISCDVMNICTNILTRHSINCPFPKICLPIDNHTYYCELIIPFIESYDFLGTNLSTEIFYYNEIISVDLDRSQLIHKNVGVNSTAFIYYNQYVFVSAILFYRFEIMKPSFIVITDQVIDQVLNFTLKFDLKAWEYSFEQVKTFRIYRKPEVVNIYRYDNRTPLMFYALIGDILTASSHALPLYRTIIHWSSKTVTFPFSLGPIISIPITSPLGHSTFICNVTLVSKSRKMLSLSRKSSIFIKLFEYLRWNNTDNFLNPSSVSQCQAKANIFYKLEIVQTLGDYLVIPQSDYIRTAGLPGGHYGFVCYFHSNLGLLYSVNLHFRLQVIADKICTFLFASVYGSIIQCGHNGFPQDEYSTHVILYIWNGNDYQFSVDSEEYLRIPYHLSIMSYKFQCTVQHNYISKITLKLEFKEFLSKKTYAKYPFSKSNRFCLKYREYVEIPLASGFTEDQVTLVHKIFWLAIIDKDNMNLIIVCFICTTSVFVFWLIIHLFLTKRSFKDLVISKANKVKLKQIRQSQINTKLHMEASKTVLTSSESVSKTFPEFTLKII